MNSGFVLCLSPAGFHKMAYAEFGPVDGPLTICVHGLTRNGRDFDKLAAALAAEGRRVICPDVVGRGKSDWLPRPELYGYPQYLADMAVLLAKFGNVPVDWVGTSMGGLIGMMLAAQPHSPIRRLVINDIGPFIPKAALERIGTYVGKETRFATLQEAEAELRLRMAPFGIRKESDWAAILATSLRTLPDGNYSLAYDPAIGAPFAAEMTDMVLWPVWDAIKCPVLLLRGVESDLLLRDTAVEMTGRGPCARLAEFAGCGHAPALMEDDQIAAICAFLGGI